MTERKQSEEALRKSEQRFRDVAYSMDGWIWEVDENGVYSHCTKKAEDILGYSPEEMLGKTPMDFMPRDEADRIGGLFTEKKGGKSTFDSCLHGIKVKRRLDP